MAVNISLRDLEDEVTCSICLDQYQDPRILPCLHTHCRKCLFGLLEKGSIQCPICRVISQVKDVSSLQVNVWVNNRLSLLELSKVEKQSGEAEQLLCGNCNLDQQATGKCFDCGTFMCDTCIKAHKLMAVLKNHQLLTLEEIKIKGIPSIEKPILCGKHKNEQQKLFCEGCETLICRDCTLIDHKGHQFGFIPDVMKGQKGNLQKKMQDLCEAKKKIESALKAVKYMQNRVRKKEETLEKGIDRTIDAQIAILNETRRNLKQTSADLTATKMKRLSSQQDGLEMHLAALTNTLNFTKSILAKGSNSDVLSLIKQINSRFSEVLEKEIDGEVDKEDMQFLEVSDKFRSNVKDYIAVQDSSTPDIEKCSVGWNDNTTICVQVRNYLNKPINIRASRIQINPHRSLTFTLSKSTSREGEFMIKGSFKNSNYYSYSFKANHLELNIDGHFVKKIPIFSE